MKEMVRQKDVRHWDREGQTVNSITVWSDSRTEKVR